MSIKSTAQRTLKRIGLYERAKASYLYDLFWRIADKQIIEARDREVAFYRELLVGLRKGDLIFDIGANQGFKTEIFLRLGAKVVAVDPDKANQTILEERFLRYRVVKKPVSVVGKAISDKNGSQTLWVDEPGSAKNTLNEKWVKILRVNGSKFGAPLGFGQSRIVDAVTLDDLIGAYGFPFFVKIDVEGHEPNVLRGLRCPVPYLSFEVNLPEFKDEGLECLNILESLAPHGRFNYVVDSEPRLAGERWVNARDFRDLLSNCSGNSIDVFWKTVG